MIFGLLKSLKSPALMTFHGVFPRANWGRLTKAAFWPWDSMDGSCTRWPRRVLQPGSQAKMLCTSVHLYVPSGKLTVCYGKSPFIMGKSPFLMGKSQFLMGKSQFLMGKSTISMAIFHTLNYQRVLYVQQNWLHTTSPMVALLLILCFFHVWAFRYTTPISRQKRWRSMFHKFLHGWRGTTIDLEITFDILWCKSSLCLRNMCLILWSWLGKYTCSTIFIHFLYPHPANLSNVSHSASRDSSEAFSVDADGKLSPLNTATWWTTASCSMARMQHRYNTIRTYEWKWMNIYIYMYTIYIYNYI